MVWLIRKRFRKDGKRRHLTIFTKWSLTGSGRSRKTSKGRKTWLRKICSQSGNRHGVSWSARRSCWVDYQDMTIVHHVQLFHNVSRAHYWYKVLFLIYFFPLLREAKYHTQPAGKQRSKVSNLNAFPLSFFNYDVFSFQHWLVVIYDLLLD